MKNLIKSAAIAAVVVISTSAMTCSNAKMKPMNLTPLEISELHDYIRQYESILNNICKKQGELQEHYIKAQGASDTTQLQILNARIKYLLKAARDLEKAQEMRF